MRIDWKELEDAFEFASMENAAFLMPETGEILWLSDGMDSEERAETEERLDGHAFFEMEPPSSSEKWNWMAAFIETVSDVQLRELLEVAIHGKGAFRRFKDVLRRAPAEEQRWYSYQAEQLRAFIQRWVEDLGVEVENPPSWMIKTDSTLDAVGTT